LTLRCPACGVPIDNDFEDCFAVTCLGCKREFCYWCFEVCEHNVHRHVANCKHSLDPGKVYSTEEYKKESRERMVKQGLDKYLRTISDKTVKKAVLLQCKDDLDDAYPGIKNHFIPQ